MTAYNIPEEVTYEMTASDGSMVSFTFKKGDVVPADEAEERVLVALVASGLASPAKTTKNKTAPSESKE